LSVSPATATAKWGKSGTQNGINYQNGSNTGFFPLSVTVNAAATTYTVTMANGGAGATGSGSYAAGATVNISAGAPSAGKQFKNWTSEGVTLADASSANTSFSMPANAVTVTANWEPIPVTNYTVTFNADGGTPIPSPQTVVSGGNATEPAAPTKVGFIFQGWYNGTTLWNFSTNTVTANITLTAKWDIGTANEAMNVPSVLVYSANGTLVIKSASEPIQKIEVFSISGRLLQAVSGGGSEVTFSGLPRGVVIVRVAVNDGIVIQKAVIK
jgi:uncharacterized repeat protein (TIGR02543 family)